jgi:succinate-semialdehyde dehydrogenase/glutarate-semialdehyde dehydrogenase
MPIATINPANGETVRTFPPLSAEALNAKLDLAVTAAQKHRLSFFPERREKMERLADLFGEEQERLARLIALEMGKPLQQGRDEAAKCATACLYYAERAEQMLADEPVPEATGRCSVRFEPLGVLLAIMPWNYPFWQVIRFAAPALMAGNVGLLKHADNVPQCAQALEDLFVRAGFDAGCFQYLAIETETVAALIEDPRIAAVTLTGSVAAGRAVGSVAGKQIKPSVLELGGSDPFIVMPSVPLADTIRQAVRGRVQNSGQSCIAAKRFLVHTKIYDEFERLLIEAFQNLRVGDPFQPDIQVGPLAAARFVDALDHQVQTAVAAGARILVGGKRGTGPGFFYPPTILTNVPADCPIYREELFGPVALLFRVEDLSAAIRLANDSPYGLGASVWTLDQDEQQRAIAELQVGQVFVNSIVASQPALPFGGSKLSGYGRELGLAGLRAFVNAKSICIAS